MIGQSLLQFRIVAKLGEGGMGVVYLATDEKLRREVALKVLPESLASDPERRRRFLREARAAAAVTHACIATVYDVGEADGHVFIAMELVSGTTLREAMAPGLAHSEALRIAKEIARGLARAHEKGVVHRDLKPENVMVTPDGDVKILDFGLAKLLDLAPVGSASALGATAEGRIMGTPAYMSPEQAEGRADIDARSDVFSFGAMLYEMLAGVPPFGGLTSVAILYAVMQTEPVPLETACPGVSVGLARTVARCLAKAREERFASGRELLAALDDRSEVAALDAPSGRALPASTVKTITAMGTALGATMEAPAAPAARVVALGAGGRSGRRARWMAGALLAALATGGGASAWLHHQGRAITITDQPIPASNVPEARSEYAAGLQTLRDDAWGIARAHFARAAALDPNMAMAHLRVAMTTRGDAEASRSELTTAIGLRSQLSARDEGLMGALEPIVARVHPDVMLANRRLEDLSMHYPNDVEILDWLGSYDLWRPDLAVQAAQRATLLDPRDGQAWEDLAQQAVRAGDAVAARNGYERVVAVAAGSLDGFIGLARLDREQGRCDSAERVMQRVTDVNPSQGLHMLASDKVAVGRPEAAIRELLNQAERAETDAMRPQARAWDDVALAVVAGRFDAVAEGLERFAAIVAPRREYEPHEALATMQVHTRVEVGDVAGARHAAREFTARSETWTRDGWGAGAALDRLPWLWRLAAIVPKEAEATRAQWIDDGLRAGGIPSLVWARAWATPASSSEEATAALEALAHDGRFAPLLMMQAGEAYGHGMVDADAGHTYLLAGRPLEAVPYLRHAATACMGLMNQFDQVHAKLDLGLALEQTGDSKGACEAFGKVVAQWGNATPRSVSAEAAREGMKRVGCAP